MQSGHLRLQTPGVLRLMPGDPDDYAALLLALIQEQLPEVSNQHQLWPAGLFTVGYLEVSSDDQLKILAKLNAFNRQMWLLKATTVDQEQLPTSLHLAPDDMRRSVLHNRRVLSCKLLITHWWT